VTRSRRASLAIAWRLVLLVAFAAGTGRAATVDEDAATPASVAAESAPQPPTLMANGLEALVPDLAEHPYHLASGARPYQGRISFSPAFGYLGSDKLYSLRVTYNPNSWLGYEAAIGHNPSQAVSAVLHTLSVVVRHPFSGRFQPYLTGGYGMLLVSPGNSINADPVTKNALTGGGGLEFFIRGDLAIRAEMRGATVFGSQRDHEGVVAYDYLQETIGFAFYRSIAP
jgi:opacity protein-like surface antigen